MLHNSEKDHLEYVLKRSITYLDDNTLTCVTKKEMQTDLMNALANLIGDEAFQAWIGKQNG